MPKSRIASKVTRPSTRKREVSKEESNGRGSEQDLSQDIPEQQSVTPVKKSRSSDIPVELAVSADIRTIVDDVKNQDKSPRKHFSSRNDHIHHSRGLSGPVILPPRPNLPPSLTHGVPEQKPGPVIPVPFTSVMNPSAPRLPPPLAASVSIPRMPPMPAELTELPLPPLPPPVRMPPHREEYQDDGDDDWHHSRRKHHHRSHDEKHHRSSRHDRHSRRSPHRHRDERRHHRGGGGDRPFPPFGAPFPPFPGGPPPNFPNGQPPPFFDPAFGRVPSMQNNFRRGGNLELDLAKGQNYVDVDDPSKKKGDQDASYHDILDSYFKTRHIEKEDSSIEPPGVHPPHQMMNAPPPSMMPPPGIPPHAPMGIPPPLMPQPGMIPGVRPERVMLDNFMSSLFKTGTPFGVAPTEAPPFMAPRPAAPSNTLMSAVLSEQSNPTPKALKEDVTIDDELSDDEDIDSLLSQFSGDVNYLKGLLVERSRLLRAIDFGLLAEGPPPPDKRDKIPAKKMDKIKQNLIQMKRLDQVKIQLENEVERMKFNEWVERSIAENEEALGILKPSKTVNGSPSDAPPGAAGPSLAALAQSNLLKVPIQPAQSRFNRQNFRQMSFKNRFQEYYAMASDSGGNVGGAGPKKHIPRHEVIPPELANMESEINQLKDQLEEQVRKVVRDASKGQRKARLTKSPSKAAAVARQPSPPKDPLNEYAQAGLLPAQPLSKIHDFGDLLPAGPISDILDRRGVPQDTSPDRGTSPQPVQKPHVVPQTEKERMEYLAQQMLEGDDVEYKPMSPSEHIKKPVARKDGEVVLRAKPLRPLLPISLKNRGCYVPTVNRAKPQGAGYKGKPENRINPRAKFHKDSVHIDPATHRDMLASNEMREKYAGEAQRARERINYLRIEQAMSEERLAVLNAELFKMKDFFEETYQINLIPSSEIADTHELTLKLCTTAAPAGPKGKPVHDFPIGPELPPCHSQADDEEVDRNAPGYQEVLDSGEFIGPQKPQHDDDQQQPVVISEVLQRMVQASAG